MASSEVSFNNELEYYFISFPCSNSGFLKKKKTHMERSLINSVAWFSDCSSFLEGSCQY